MAPPSKEVIKLQTELKNQPSDFLNSDPPSSDEETEVTKTISKHDASAISKLMTEFLAQQRQLLKVTKRIFSLENELNTQEIKDRYLKLDYNNALLELNETKEKYQRASSENVKLRAVAVAYVIYFILYYWLKF